jgi:hypothetical protein
MSIGTAADTEQRINELGAWFQNLTLNGVTDGAASFSRRLSRGEVCGVRSCVAG